MVVEKKRELPLNIKGEFKVDSKHKELECLFGEFYLEVGNNGLPREVQKWTGQKTMEDGKKWFVIDDYQEGDGTGFDEETNQAYTIQEVEGGF